jgi:hypothetical protein
MISDWFDRYSLQARLAPALLSLFPAILLVALQFPLLYDTAAGLVGLALVCGVLTLASHFARTRGKKVEQRLNARWGGRPTTRFLLNDSYELDERTRKRYLTHFSNNIPEWSLGEEPTLDIDSAVRWLLEKTRDTTVYSLIFKENISYGFRRNCLGMKPVGLFVAVLCVMYWSVQIYFAYTDAYGIDPTHMIGLSTCIFLLIWWLFIVGDSWVKEAGNAYAKALLGSIDTMG